jgi:hypothetical protein
LAVTGERIERVAGAVHDERRGARGGGLEPYEDGKSDGDVRYNNTLHAAESHWLA